MIRRWFSLTTAQQHVGLVVIVAIDVRATMHAVATLASEWWLDLTIVRIAVRRYDFKHYFVYAASVAPHVLTHLTQIETNVHFGEWCRVMWLVIQ